MSTPNVNSNTNEMLKCLKTLKCSYLATYIKIRKLRKQN